MSILLETTFGDLVLDLDIKGSPLLSKNILKLAKARYFTNTLIYKVAPGKYCQMGDPRGDGTGGCSIYGIIDAYQGVDNSAGRSRQPTPDVTKSQRRFLQSQGRQLSSNELNQKGVVIATEMGNIPHTIGSQFLITLSENNGLSDLAFGSNSADTEGKGNNNSIRYFSLGTVAEDTQNILSKLNRAYCDDDGRPFADIRIQRALVIHDPFEEDPEGMNDLLRSRGVTIDTSNNGNVVGDDDLNEGYPLAPRSPKYDKPPEEAVPTRIQADDTTLFATAGWDETQEFDEDEEEDEETRQKRLEIQEKQEEEWRKRQDTSRAVMLEMLGDRPSAEIEAPENVLFVCKLNPLTTDEDLELIFARFDSSAKAEIIRDPDTGASLQYAFVEFATNESCNEAYLKMNNALVDDRRIRVDFSQSVAKVWDRYNKRYRQGDRSGGIDRGFTDAGRGRGGGGGGRGRGGRDRGRGFTGRGPMNNSHHRHNTSAPPRHTGQPAEEVDNFGRRARPKDVESDYRPRSDHDRSDNRRSFTRSPSPSRNHEKQRMSRSRSRSRSYSRSRSRSSDSYDSRRRKKHKRHRHKRKHRSRSRSRDRDRKKKHHKHSSKHRREYSDEEDYDRRHSRKHKKRDR
jgi:peptidyl-prolyl cis-trans isomerase-like 4